MNRLAILPALALAVVLGCKTAAMMGPKDQKEPLANVERDEDGVCAHHEIISSNDVIKACARQGAGGAVLYSDLTFYARDPYGDGASWHVVVTRDDGVDVLDTHLTGARPKRGFCVASVCFGRFISLDPAGEPWRAGRYELRYTSAADGKTRRMSITLQ
jgi:hypothetical protein